MINTVTLNSASREKLKGRFKVTFQGESLPITSWSLTSSVYSMAAVSEAKRSSDPKDTADHEEEKRATHDHFKEIEEVRELIDSLKNVWNDLRGAEMACERFTCKCRHDDVH